MTGCRDTITSVAGNRPFDEARFEELVLYVAWATRDNPQFGRTKLAKVLFYCDFAAFAEEGSSLTGARYEHWQFGPFPPALDAIEERIAATHKADVTRFRSDEAGLELRIVPFSEPRIRHFEEWDEWQRPMVDSYITKVASMPSWRVSDDSHKHPGWVLTRDYEEIPYHSTLISRRQPTRDDYDRAEQIAAQLGWD